jgi:ABC-type transporter Mla subunit MlaD
LKQICRQNDACPDIQTCLTPILADLEQTYPPFLNEAGQYYKLYANIQRTAKVSQVLSSANAQMAMTPFLAAWHSVSRVIDEYADAHPPPHAKEISTKFHSIKSSLEIISQTNSNRKYPNLGISKSVIAIQALCDSMTDSIIALFAQPQFPHFQTDSLKVYKADVRGFLRVVNEAFYNEFPQSGVPGPDLARIKLNVMSSCNDILAALAAAFAFLPMMKETQDLKKSFDDATGSIIACFSQPFNIVKPLNPCNTMPAEGQPSPLMDRGRAAAENSSDLDSQLRRMDPRHKVELFLFEVLPFFDIEFVEVQDPWVGLQTVASRLRGLLTGRKTTDGGGSVLQAQVDDLKKEVEVLTQARIDSIAYANEAIADYRRQVEELREKLKKAEQAYAVLNSVTSKQQEQIESLADLPKLRTRLRKSLTELTGEALVEDISDDQVIEGIKNASFAIAARRVVLPSVDLRAELVAVLGLDANAQPSDVIDAVTVLKTSKPEVIEPPPEEEPVVMEPTPTKMSLKANPVEQQLRQQILEVEKSHLQNVQSICARLQSFLGGQPEMAEDITGQNAVLDNQLSALKRKLQALIENDGNIRAAMRRTESELSAWTSAIASVIGPNDNLLDAALGMLNGTMNPLRDKLIELSGELRRRDIALKAIWTRVSGIWNVQSEEPEEPEVTSESPYYEVKPSNLPHLILQSLQLIHTNKERHQKRNSELEKTCDQLRSSLRSIEARLRRSVNGNCSTDQTSEAVIDRIHRFIDGLISPQFSKQFMAITEVNSLCETIPNKSNADPNVYLPQICHTYLEMEQGIAAIQRFSPLLDALLQRWTPESGQRDFPFLQQQLNDLHSLVQTLSRAAIPVPVFVTAMRFVSLIQTLGAQIGTLTGNEVKISLPPPYLPS